MKIAPGLTLNLPITEEAEAATYGTRLGDFFEGFVETEAKAIGKTVDELRQWGRQA